MIGGDHHSTPEHYDPRTGRTIALRCSSPIGSRLDAGKRMVRRLGRIIKVSGVHQTAQLHQRGQPPAPPASHNLLVDTRTDGEARALPCAGGAVIRRLFPGPTPFHYPAPQRCQSLPKARTECSCSVSTAAMCYSMPVSGYMTESCRIYIW